MSWVKDNYIQRWMDNDSDNQVGMDRIDWGDTAMLF